MDVLSGVVIAVVTFTVLLGGATVAGFVVLFRRRGNPQVSARSGESLGRQAGSMLVSLDTALREADEELGFALAQFGAERAREYRDALADARTRVTEAFRLKQALDDHIPESDRQRREWTLQIIALCEQAQANLAAQEARFGQLRALEANAAGTLAALRERIAANGTRLDAARATLAELAPRYAPEALARITGNPDEAQQLLEEARAACDSAEPGIAASGVNDVSGSLTEAASAIRSAEQALEAVERTARDLADASTALEALRKSTRADLVEARAQRDSAPDADTGAAIIAAMAQVESALRGNGDPGHPVAELDRIGAAVAQLDLALASARNQASRLEHARAAFEGTLVSATSQIAVARELIARRGGNVTARTRLAEAERQLMIAQAETDPVEALDAIRRAVTHARDADALARY